MDSTSVAILVICGMLLLIAIRVPIGFALAGAGAVGVLLIQDFTVATAVLGESSFSKVSSYALIVIPLYVALGMFVRETNMSTDLFAFGARITRRIPGGTAISTVFASAVFAAVSGSSVATIAALGPMSLREMRRQGYSDTFASGVIGVAGTLGVLIPPSIPLVIYGITTGESIGALLIAAVIPGILTALMFGIAICAFSTKRLSATRFGIKQYAPVGAAVGGGRAEMPATAPTSVPVTRTAVTLGKFGALFLVVIGGIYLGWFTPTESAAVGALLALLMLVSERLRERRPVWGVLRDATTEAVTTTAMILVLVLGSGVLAYFLLLSQTPQRINEGVTSLDLPPVVIILVIFLVLAILGMFLEGLSLLLVAVPLFYPVVIDLGYDGIWFGIIALKAIELGLITPPVGINAYVVANLDKELGVEKAFRGMAWFIPVDLVTVGLLIAFPSLVTWLPSIIN